MGLKPRIQARTEAPPVRTPKPILVKRPAAMLFGEPLNINKIRADGPKITGYICVASWEVLPTDDQIMAFLELEQALGNVNRMYHGTKVHSVEDIVKAGLRKGWGGMFGGGIYMGGIHKAIGYAWGTPTAQRTGCYASPWKAHYVLEIDAVLGKIKACMESDHSLNLGKVKGEGYDSVGGFANQTNSWGGKLRHNEYVVYDPKQVLIRRIHEYQTDNAPTDTLIPTQGSCELIVEKVDPRMPGTFKDVMSQKACGNLAFNNLRAHVYKAKHNTQSVWVCAKCIEERKLRAGDRVVKAGYRMLRIELVLT